MRLIDADVLKAKVTTSSSAAMRAQAKTACNNLIDRAPTIEPQWIPCSERLPEEYGEYLVTWTTSQSKRPLIAICEGEETLEYDHERNRFKFEWLLDDYIKVYPNAKVIAWMPLPEPYKGGDSE